MIERQKSSYQRELIGGINIKMHTDESDILQQYSNLKRKYKDYNYSVHMINLQTQGIHRWCGGQICGNDIYGIPNHEASVLKLNMSSLAEKVLGHLSAQQYKWTGGTVYRDYILGFPRSANSLLVVDTITNDIREIDLQLKYAGEHHYGGVCTPEGIIYQPPRNNDHILVIDIENRTCRRLYVDGLGKNARYCGSVIHPNGSIYFLPEKGRVMKLDLKTEELSFIGDTINPMCFDAKIALDGNIYGYSAYLKGILKIDVNAGNGFVIHQDQYFGSYGTKSGINGKLYSIPGDGRYVWEYDPIYDNVKIIADLADDTKAKFAGGATDRYGNIYAIPADANKILIYRPDMKTEIIPDDVYCSFFQDCY